MFICFPHKIKYVILCDVSSSFGIQTAEHAIKLLVATGYYFFCMFHKGIDADGFMAMRQIVDECCDVRMVGRYLSFTSIKLFLHRGGDLEKSHKFLFFQLIHKINSNQYILDEDFGLVDRCMFGSCKKSQHCDPSRDERLNKAEENC